MSNQQPPTMAIFVTPNGIQVAGPLHDKIACYGILMAAMDAVRDFKPDAAPKLFVPPPGTTMPPNGRKL